jgi:hypothetical protein
VGEEREQQPLGRDEGVVAAPAALIDLALVNEDGEDRILVRPAPPVVRRVGAPAMGEDEPPHVEDVPGADAPVGILVDHLVAEEASPVDSVLPERPPVGTRVGIGELVPDHVLEPVVERADVVEVGRPPRAPVIGPNRRVLADRTGEPGQVRSEAGAAKRAGDEQEAAAHGRGRCLMRAELWSTGTQQDRLPVSARRLQRRRSYPRAPENHGSQHGAPTAAS